MRQATPTTPGPGSPSWCLFLLMVALGGCMGSNSSTSTTIQAEGSIPVINGSGAPAGLHLAFVARPYDTVAGSRMRPVRVAVLDEANHRVASARPIITLSIADGRGTLSGRLAVQARKGEARFDDLIPERAGRHYALVALADGMSSVTSHSFRVTEPPPELVSIQVDPPGPSVAAGYTQAFAATGVFSRGQRRDVTTWVTWSSADSTVATVTASGSVTGEKAGSTSITARYAGVVGTATVTVTPAVLTSLAVTPSPAFMPSRTQKALAATGVFSDGSTQDLSSVVDWSSSNDQVAQCQPEGLVSSIGVGSATVAATDASGVQGSTVVTVTPSGAVGPIFSTYLGGKTSFSSAHPLTFAQNTAIDDSGFTYVTGATSVSDLPLVDACQSSPADNSTWTAFVAKYGVDGEVMWCTYLGGNGHTMGVGIGVLPNGWVAVTGLTTSDRDFPIVNAAQPTYGGHEDAFLTVYDADGTVRYSTYIGGKDVEGPSQTFSDDNTSGNNLAVDGQGLVYVTCETCSHDFPVTTNAIQHELNLGPRPAPTPSDAYVCIFDPSQSGGPSLVYSSLLGGEKSEKGHAVAVDPTGKFITIAGYTASREFPTTPNGYRSAPSSDHFTSNGFVAQFTSSDPGKISSHYAARYSTYVGGDGEGVRDDTYALALGPGGVISVTGRTESATFPVTPDTAIYGTAPYLDPKAGDEPYLVKLDPSLSGAASLVYGTYLGKGGFGTSLAVDAHGASFVGGEVMADGTLYTPAPPPVEAPTLFPYTTDAFFTTRQGSTDCLLMQVSGDGRTLSYSTFFGGTGNDRTYGLAVDRFGNLHWTGLTLSRDFPLQNAAQIWPGNKKKQNAFVTKFGAF